MKKLTLQTIIILFTLGVIFSNTSCEELFDVLNEILEGTGWLIDEEDMDNIPNDITPFDDKKITPAPSVSLESKFPPVGDQGKYGTCVAWAVGYNLKTALNAIEKGWTTSQLAVASNQGSPKDLWMAIPSNKKNAKCDGTNFEAALDALISRGLESMSTVPYTNMNSDNVKSGNSANKLANYRKIASETEGLKPENFKGYLNQGRPIAFGAKLGDRFMSWNSSAVLSSDTYNNPGMQHAYHAMVLTGYDDAKRAFRVRNSWGPSWGDRGSIWVDYNFFCKNFCFAAFVAQNPAPTMGSVPTLTGNDLLALWANDYLYDGDEHFTRSFKYSAYNAGTTTITPSQHWSVVYMYYNAKNAKDYEIIYEDYYTTEYGGKEGDSGTLNETQAIVGGWWVNETLKPKGTVGDDWIIHYVMPKITGSYYLVLMVDAYDVIREANEDNNFYFVTAANGKPIEFKDGVALNKTDTRSVGLRSAAVKLPENFANTETQTLVTPENPNTYTPDELKTMLLHDKKTGKLDAKIRTYSATKDCSIFERVLDTEEK